LETTYEIIDKDSDYIKERLVADVIEVALKQ
jgi:hypothetical protein